MKKTQRLKALICVAGMIGLAVTQQSQATPITQTTAAAGSDYYAWGGGNSWNHVLGSVVLAQGTNMVTGLTSSVYLRDQGWGNQSGHNGVKIGLFDNGHQIWSQFVAGANHYWQTDVFNIAAFPEQLDALNLAIGAIDWSAAHSLTMNMYTNALGYPGWELHTRNATFSVTSTTIPEPATFALLAVGLLGMGLRKRRKT